MKSGNVEGGFYFVEGEIFQIIRAMTGFLKTKMDFDNRGGWNKRGGWKIFMKSINVEGDFVFVEC